jgi:hypothetical protein
MAQNESEQKPVKQVEIECPHCKKKFWHKVGTVLGQFVDALGNAIGEAKFGEE